MIIYQLAALFKPPENGAPEFSYVTPAHKFYYISYRRGHAGVQLFPPRPPFMKPLSF